jgi:hypothetical protein
MTDDLRYYLLRKRLIEETIVKAFRSIRALGIEPILIKGWAAARNYPSTVPRFSADVDVAVSQSDYETAKTLVAGPNPAVTGVDLHKELRHLDTVSWNILFANSETVKIGEESIRILCPEDHLRVLCVHWLTNGGESRDRLWDIVYAVSNRPENFDWSKCLDVISETRRGWVISTIALAHRYLGLELDGLPFEVDASSLPSWLIKCVEGEWAHDAGSMPLESQIKTPSQFIRQLRRRIPPNPIQATINCEGELGDGSRIRYQIRDMLNRLLPSVRRVSAAIVGRQL